MTDQVLLFDIDGVLVDSCFAHLVSLQKMFSDINFEYTRYHEDCLGSLCTADKIKHINSQYSLQLNEAEIKNMIAKKFEYLDLDDITFNEFVPHIFNYLDLNNVNYGLVTNARIEYVKFIMQRGKIHNPKVIASNSLNLKNKPNPDLYEYAVKELLVDRTKILVFEDSKEGIAAATRAKLKVHVVPSPSYLTLNLIKDIVRENI